MTQKKHSPITIILVSSVLVTVGLLSIYLLERRGITNFFERNTTITADNKKPSAELSNTVDYGPAKESDNQPVAVKGDRPLESQPPAQMLAVTITRTSYSTDQTQYLVKAAISGTQSGTCTAVLVSGSKRIEASGSIGLVGGQVSCVELAFSANAVQASNTWHLTVTAKNGTNSAQDQRDLTL